MTVILDVQGSFDVHKVGLGTIQFTGTIATAAPHLRFKVDLPACGSCSRGASVR